MLNCSVEGQRQATIAEKAVKFSHENFWKAFVKSKMEQFVLTSLYILVHEILVLLDPLIIF